MTRREFLPVARIGDAEIPQGLDVPRDTDGKVYRVVRLDRMVEPGSRLRAVSMGLAGRQVGAVLRQVPNGKGVAALIALYRGENAPADPDAEIMVEAEVSAPPAVPRPQETRNIFDFT